MQNSTLQDESSL